MTITLGSCLTRLAQGRDEVAWHDLIALVGEELHRFAVRLTGNAAAADDVLQETFLQVRDHAARFRPRTGDPDGDARRWLRRIVLHVASGYVRRERRLRRRAQAAAPPAAMVVPEDALVHDEEGALVRACLADLPASMRDAIVLHHLEGVGYPDLARELSCPVGTAKARVHRGMERLRQRLMAAGVDRSVAAIGLALARVPTTASHPVAPLLQPLLHSTRVAHGSVAMGAGLAALASASLAVGMLAVGVPLLVGGESAAPLAVSPATPPAPALAPPPGIAPPATLPPGVLVAVVVPDLPTAQAHLQHLFAGSPYASMVDGGIRQLLSSHALLQASRLTLVIGAGLPPAVAVIIPRPADDAALAAIRAAQLGNERLVGQQIVVASDGSGLALGVQAAPALASLTQVAVDGDVRVVVDLHGLAQLYGPLLNLAIHPDAGAVPPGISAAQAETIVRGEVAMFLAVAGDCDRLQCDARLGGDGIRVHTTLAAVPSSALAPVLQPPSTAALAALPDLCARLGPEQGILALRGILPMAPMARYVEHLLSAHPELDAVLSAQFTTRLVTVAHCTSGALAEALRCDAHDVVHCDCATSITDPARTQQAIRSFLLGLHGTPVGALLSPSTTLAQAAFTLPNPRQGPPLAVDALQVEIPASSPPAAEVPSPILLAYTADAWCESDRRQDLERMVAGGRAPLVLGVAAALGVPAADGECVLDLGAVAQYERSVVRQDHGRTEVPALAIPHAHPTSQPPLRTAWRLSDGMGEAVVDLPKPSLVALLQQGLKPVNQPQAQGAGVPGQAEPPIAPAPPAREF